MLSLQHFIAGLIVFYQILKGTLAEAPDILFPFLPTFTNIVSALGPNPSLAKGTPAHYSQIFMVLSCNISPGCPNPSLDHMSWPLPHSRNLIIGTRSTFSCSPRCYSSAYYLEVCTTNSVPLCLRSINMAREHRGRYIEWGT